MSKKTLAKIVIKELKDGGFEYKRAGDAEDLIGMLAKVLEEDQVLFDLIQDAVTHLFFHKLEVVNKLKKKNMDDDNKSN